jgi:hypothetical protein
VVLLLRVVAAWLHVRKVTRLPITVYLPWPVDSKPHKCSGRVTEKLKNPQRYWLCFEPRQLGLLNWRTGGPAYRYNPLMQRAHITTMPPLPRVGHLHVCPLCPNSASLAHRGGHTLGKYACYQPLTLM